MPYDRYEFTLKPLPYAYDALEPFISAETLQQHHSVHLKNYVDNLNRALDGYPRLQSMSLEQLLRNVNRLPASIRTAVQNNGGGVYNHNFYFDSMSPEQSIPTGILERALVASFGSLQSFASQMAAAAAGIFGSGWAWLVADRSGRLRIITLPNQDTPLSTAYCPILPLDMWEHAYYLDYRAEKSAYIQNWFPLINWDEVAARYLQCLRNRTR